MTTVLVTVLVVLVVLLAAASVTAALVARRLHRPLELVPGTRGPVPLGWRWSLSQPAVLHKRLLLAMAGVRLAAGGGLRERSDPAPWADLVAETERLAVGVEARLVVAAGQPRALRRRLMAQLEPEVAQVEQVAGRLVGTIDAWAEGSPDMSAAQLLERLDAVNAALADVARANTTAELGPVPASSVLPPLPSSQRGSRRAPG
ncbi:MAG TPA: hypothetical protein VKI64_05860 [Acidimicrobiales bacterium]|nr:hypothetical protein [Acidimicrobiales bacterium]